MKEKYGINSNILKQYMDMLQPKYVTGNEYSEYTEYLNWDDDITTYINKNLEDKKNKVENEIKIDVLNTKTAIKLFLTDNHYNCNIDDVLLFDNDVTNKVVINRIWFVINRKKSFINYFDDVEKHDKWLIEYLQGYCIANEVTDLYFQNGVGTQSDELTRYKLPFGTL